MAEVTELRKDQPPPATNRTDEIGIVGLKAASGYVYEELLTALQGDRGRKAYSEMSHNDGTIGAILFAIGLLIRAVEWEAQPIDDDQAKMGGFDDAKDYVDSLIEDMSHSWEDFICEVMSMLPFGWAYFETVLKRRVGPYETDPKKRSRYTDGLIGVRKLAPRSQDSLYKWELQEDGGITGMWQIPPYGYDIGGMAQRFIPIERSLLFRTQSRRNNPEGVSILRTAYTAWRDKRGLEEQERLAIQNELTGIPIARVPVRYLKSDASAADLAIRQKYETALRDMRQTEMTGMMIPSEVYANADGSLSSIPQVDFSLLTSGGTRSIDIRGAIEAKRREMAQSCLSDFILLGEGASQTRGSFSMHESKVDLLVRACYSILRQIAYPLNSFLLPRLWSYNGMDPDLMPELAPGKIMKTDLDQLGIFLRDLSTAGISFAGDPDVEAYIREEADLPPKSAETAASQADQQAVEAAARAVGGQGNRGRADQANATQAAGDAGATTGNAVGNAGA